jgi:hypothetical protein
VKKIASKNYEKGFWLGEKIETRKGGVKVGTNNEKLDDRSENLSWFGIWGGAQELSA